MTEGRGWHLGLTHPADGVDRLGDVATVNLCQFPARERGKWVHCPHPALPAQRPHGSRPRGPYASFLCFSLVLASEILLWRFLSRIFCNSFFSLEEPVGEDEGSVAGLGALPLSWHQEPPAPPIQDPVPSPVIHLLQPLDLSGVSIQDDFPEPLQSLWTQVTSR